MAEFKPMVKMMTTEPTVTLKLKKGGTVKKMNGGIMGALANAPSAGGPAMPAGNTARKMAMMKGRKKKMPLMGGAPMSSAPMGGAPMIKPAPMKEGGETSKMHAKEMTKMSNLEKEMKHHESMKASKAHKGLKTGGVVNGQGGFKTGGVVKGQGGFKDGGMAMVEYGGKMVPKFTADGKGKMKHGGKAMMHGGTMHGYKKGGKAC
jgi:hypothetical protein